MFVLYFDRGYFEWAPMLIESIEINEPEELVCVYGINLTRLQTDVLESYGNVRYFEYDISNRPVLSFEKRARKYTDINMAKIVQCQPDFLLKSFDAFPEEMLFIIMDVDCLIIRPLDELKKGLLQHDLAGMVQGSDESRISCGFKAIKRTDVNKEIIEEWDIFLSNGHHYYGKAPTLFMEFYQKRRKRTRLLRLDARYIDPSSQEDSFIWSAHKSRLGSKAERAEIYKKKLEEMRNKLYAI